MLRAFLLAALIAPVVACSNGDASTGQPKTTTTTTTTTTTAAAPTADPAAQAKEIFGTRCMACHGPEGRGDGPASVSLTPKPRNFHDTAWQAKVDDAHIMTIIKVGGAAVGLSPAMPSNPDLNSKDDVVAALKDYVRGLGKVP